MRVCPNCGEENPDRAKFWLNCATALEEAAVPRETRKVVTVLFTDVTGSTSLGEHLDPGVHAQRHEPVLRGHAGCHRAARWGGGVGEALAAQERFDEAEGLAERARAITVEDDAISQMGWRGLIAKVLAVRGSSVEAERLSGVAVEIIDATGYLDARSDTWMRRGEVLRLGGKDAKAAEALRQALALSERKGNVVWAERDPRELAEMAGRGY